MQKTFYLCENRI